MKSNLIINYVPNKIRDAEFKEMFEPFGSMTNCKLIKDRHTGQSLGFGFVKYETDDMAAAAIASLNGKQLMNKRMKVSVARPEGQKAEKSELYVSNLPLSFSQEQISALFSAYGSVQEVKLFTDHNSGDSRGVAFVRMCSMETASRAISELAGSIIAGCEHPIEVKEFVSRSRKFEEPVQQVLAQLHYGYLQQPMYAYVSPTSYGQQHYSPSGPRSPLDSELGSLTSSLGAMHMGGQVQSIYQPHPGYYHQQMPPQQMAYPAVVEGEPSATVFVFHLPTSCSEETLTSLFVPFATQGPLQGVTIVRNKTDGSSRGFAFVNFSSVGEATTAIDTMNGYHMGSKYLKCSYKK